MSADPLTEEIPLAKPVLGDAEEAAVVDVLRSGQLSLGPRVPAFEEAFAARIGVPYASAVSSGTAGLHLALRAVGVSDGDEVVTSPFSFVASANVILYERARPVFADIDPRTLNLDPQAAAAAITDRTTALLPVHIFGYPADIAGVRAARPADRRGRLRGARRGPRRRRRRSAAAAIPRRSASTPTSSSPPARAACSRSARRRTRSRSTPSATRAARPTWAGSTTTGSASTTASRTSRPRSGSRSSSGSTACSPTAPASPTCYRTALAPFVAERGLELPCEDSGGDRRGWFVFVVQLPRGLDRDDTIRSLRELGVQSKPYLPAIHLMSFYRERFGHRPGEFPVCEDVAARSVALPFFPELTEAQVARVAEALGRVLG